MVGTDCSAGNFTIQTSHNQSSKVLPRVTRSCAPRQADLGSSSTASATGVQNRNPRYLRSADPYFSLKSSTNIYFQRQDSIHAAEAIMLKSDITGDKKKKKNMDKNEE